MTTTTPPQSQTPGFGTTSTAHLLSQQWTGGRWWPAQIRTFEEIKLSPFAQSLHYGQSVFEGLQAYPQPDGTVSLFRPADHLRRLNVSARRLCLPEVDPARLLADIRRLLTLDHASCPEAPGCLYIRPLLFADEPSLSPKVPSSARLLVMLSPAHGYFQQPEGLRLVTALDSVRATPGGTGSVKCAGNYAGVLRRTAKAKAEGFDEVLWLDATEQRYVEETGTTNIFLVRDGVLTTPELTDSILAGITRDTILRLARDLDMPCRQARVAIDSDWSSVTEVFTSGTASSLMHVREIVHRGETIFRRTTPGTVTLALSDQLHAMRFGAAADRHRWRVVACTSSDTTAGQPDQDSSWTD